MTGIFDPTIVSLTPPRPAGFRILLLGIMATLSLAVGAEWVAGEYGRGQMARALLSRCYERRIVIADLLSRLKDAETEQRAYLMTGNPVFLSLYRAAAAGIDDRRERLETLLINVPRQEAQYVRLTRAIEVELQELNTALETGTVEPQRIVQRGFGAGEGRLAVDRARAAAGAMMMEEDRMIAARSMEWNARAVVTRRNLRVLTMAVVVLIWGGLALWWRSRQLRYGLGMQAVAASARLRGVFTGSRDAIALLDTNGRIEAVSPAVMRWLGHEPATLIGRDIGTLVDALPPEGSLIERIGLNAGEIVEPLRIDRVAHHADGRAVPADVAFGLMPMPGGLHVVATIRDISERKAVDRMKDEFIATVSHELRTPLTSIVGALGLLRATSGETLPEAARRLVMVAEENSGRLIHLVNDLLDIEKMDAGAFRFHNVPLDLAPVLRRAAQGSEGLAAVKQVAIELAIPPGTLQVRGDDGRLAQVATNLLANAIRFSPPGGTVTLVAERREGRAIVTVEDRGPGVPESFRDHLFTRFAQAEGTASAGGTGLGLAISRQIVRSHGGALWFEPRPGGGARFRFSIELRDAENAPPHLLIFAEAPDVAGTLRTTAETGGCRADRVGTLADAHAAIRSAAYDAVLIDLDAAEPMAAALLARMQDEAVDGCLPIPVVARKNGVTRVGVGVDERAWSRIREADGGLAARLQRIMEGLGDEKPLILHIDDDGRLFDRTAVALQPWARMQHAFDLAGAEAILLHEKPAVIILERELSDGQGDALLAWLKAAEGFRDIPTILYSARPTPAALERLVDVVVMKSPRSLRNLVAAVDRLLARTATMPADTADDRAGSAVVVAADTDVEAGVQ